MNKKTYWKEACLLFIGLLIGMFIERNYSGTIIPAKKVITIERDTLVYRDTLYATHVIPLNKENVLAELHRQKIPHANIVLAQSILETGHYTSYNCKNKNNLFGMRKGKDYKSYSNWKESILDYKKLISKRFKDGDYYEFLNKIGYAEDPKYTQLLKNIV